MWPQAVYSGAAGRQFLLSPLVDSREAQRRAQIQAQAQPGKVYLWCGLAGV